MEVGFGTIGEGAMTAQKGSGVGEDPNSAKAAMSTDSPPSDEFHAFLVALATDPTRLGAFIKDPDAAMRAAGVDEVDQVILKSGQPATIYARLSGQKFGPARNSVYGRAVEPQPAMAWVKRSPKRTANWALAIAHSPGGILHSFSARFKTRNRSFSAA